MIRCAASMTKSTMAIAAMLVAIAANAADYNWTGSGDGHSWSDANN